MATTKTKMAYTKEKNKEVGQSQRRKGREGTKKQNGKIYKYVPKARPLEVGAHGVNPRLDTNEKPLNPQIADQSPGSITRVQVRARVQDRAIAYLAMGIVLKAIKKGSEAAQKSTEFPYYQWRYLIDVITNTMTGGTMLLTTAPRWLWELLYALKPKERPCKTGSVSYSWDIINTGYGTDQQFQLGTGEDNYSVFWGTGVVESGTSSVNGFPVLGAVAAYDPNNTTVNSAALAALWPFLTNNISDIIGDPGADGVCTGHDTSAFSVVYPELGESYGSPGAVKTTIYSERHIDSPLLCQFAMYQPVGTPLWRGWNEARQGSGSPCMIGPVLCDLQAIKEMRNKASANFKFYNFDEFFEQLSLTLANACERLIASGQVPIPCPLTSLTVQILLRQTILVHTNNECAQDVRYSGAQYIDLLPFTVSPNGTLGGTGTAMLLPTFLAENIRAIASFGVKLSKKWKNSMMWLSVLARPAGTPQISNYTWGPNGENLYAVDSSETPVNIIDCSALVAQQTVYLDLTRTAIKVYEEEWNKWITQFSAVLSPLVIPGSEKGITALNANLYTKVQEEVPLPADISPVVTAGQLQKRKSLTKVSVGLDLMKFKKAETVAPVGGYFATVAEKYALCNTGFARQLDPIIENWIMPVNWSVNSIDDASTQGYQIFLSEMAARPCSTSGGIGSTGDPALLPPNAYDRHMRAALLDVKSFATGDQQNEIIQALSEQARRGRGGFLSAALSGLANMVAPGLGDIVNTVMGG
jgi:hypothetical protein